MRHLKSGRQLSRNSAHRWALMRNLITSLLRDEKIRTTDPKAKELRRWVDRVITLGKQGSLHARRQALSIVQDKAVVRKLFDTIGPRFKDRPGGYTRIIKIGIRRGEVYVDVGTLHGYREALRVLSDQAAVHELAG